MAAEDELFNDGAAYERLMGRWSRRVGDIFIDWIAVPDNLRWLDLGCGTGAFTEEIVKRCSPAALVGVDPSAEQLAFAQTRPGLERTEFRVGDAERLPLPDNSFDVAVMALVIHFIPDPAKAIGEIARVVRPGGLAASYVWDYTQQGSPTAPIASAIKAIGFDSPSPPSPQATSLAALQALWEGAAFEGIEARTINISVEFSDFDEFWSSMTARVGPAGKVLARMSPQDLDRLRDTLKQKMAVTSDGRVIYEARANAIKGRKRA